jgi:hypothetical protein
VSLRCPLQLKEEEEEEEEEGARVHLLLLHRSGNTQGSTPLKGRILIEPLVSRGWNEMAFYPEVKLLLL